MHGNQTRFLFLPASGHKPDTTLCESTLPVGPSFSGPPVITALVWLAHGTHRRACRCSCVSGFLLFFFRDPERVHNAPPSAVISPADGRVMVAGAPTGEATPPGRWQQISVFLSPMDVHVNRIPVSGRVTRVEYHPGRFLPAYKKESGDLNERSRGHHRSRRAADRRSSDRRVSWRAGSSAAREKGSR